MRRIIVGVVVILGLSAAVAVSGGRKLLTSFTREARNPVTHLRWGEEPGDFQFAIVSDRTGGHRANIFAQAVHKLNLLQPAFVVSVGDLIEGGKKTDPQYAAEWQEFDGLVKQLTMPFFYVSGNHDVGTKESAQFWADKLGRRHYHFVYRDVLFLILNSDDPPGVNGALAKEQIAWAKETLAKNSEVRWTMVLLHRPLWTVSNGSKNGWGVVEAALAGRPYTVVVGHVHRFQKWTRQGQQYYQLATTGGGSLIRGVDYGEFDHITWVTMRAGGPVIAHLTLDAIHTEDLQPIATAEPAVKRTKLPVHPAAGRAHFEGTPIPGAIVLLTPVKAGVRAVGRVEADGTFKLSTYTANDGAAAGDYTVTIAWRERLPDGNLGPSLLPERYGKADRSELRATIRAGNNDLVFELKR